MPKSDNPFSCIIVTSIVSAAKLTDVVLVPSKANVTNQQGGTRKTVLVQWEQKLVNS